MTYLTHKKIYQLCRGWNKDGTNAIISSDSSKENQEREWEILLTLHSEDCALTEIEREETK